MSAEQLLAIKETSAKHRAIHQAKREQRRLQVVKRQARLAAESQSEVDLELVLPEAQTLQLSPDNKHCVYMYYDDLDRLLYIGMSTIGFQRVFQFAPTDSKYAGDGSKSKKILLDAAKVEVYWFNSKEEAANTEKLAIQKLKPVWNRRHNKKH